MTPADELLQAVLANPADDTPRLVYADALDECGEVERAEFIRLSIATHGKTHHPFCRDGCGCDYGPAKARCDELATNHAFDWFPTIPGGSSLWSRGFISELRGPLESLLRHGGEIARRQPVTAWMATDKEPYSGNSTSHCFGWNPGNETFGQLLPAFVLPFEIIDALEVWGRVGNWLIFPTRDAAMTALSEAVGRVVRSIKPGRAEVTFEVRDDASDALAYAAEAMRRITPSPP